jgi:nucleotide-binding universal stress UspA family protein
VILVCYDGSVDAQSAIDRAAELMPGEPAAVLTVWEGLAEVLARSGGFGVGVGALDFEGIDETSERFARERAEEGAERARLAGLAAEPRVRKRGATIWETILAEADETAARTIVMGSRGLTGLKSLLLGSVSHAVLQHADRPVTVVPSPEVAARRAAERH